MAAMHFWYDHIRKVSKLFIYLIHPLLSLICALASWCSCARNYFMIRRVSIFQSSTLVYIIDRFHSILLKTVSYSHIIAFIYGLTDNITLLITHSQICEQEWEMAMVHESNSLRKTGKLNILEQLLLGMALRTWLDII